MLLPLAFPHPLTGRNHFGVSRPVDFTPARPLAPGTLASRKRDGIRCIVWIPSGQHARYFTRTGREITGLDQLDEPLRTATEERQTVSPEGIILDGELTLATPDGSDDFAGIVSAIQRKNYTVPNPQLWFNDLLTADEFRVGHSPRPYHTRLAALAELLPTDCTGPVKRVQQVTCETSAALAEEVGYAIKNGWEGLVLRGNTPYRGFDDETIQKVKRWPDFEVTVKAVTRDGEQLRSLRVQSRTGQNLILTRGLESVQAHFGDESPVGATLTIETCGETLKEIHIKALYPAGRLC